MTGDRAPAARPIEVELKYRLSNVDTGLRLLDSYGLAGFAAETPLREVVQTDRYVDTADGALEKAGYACRFRATIDGAVVTLKGLRRQDDGGVVHRREELEGPARNRALPPSAWPESAVRARVLQIAGDATLVDRVTVRQVRRKRDYYRDSTVVELSVDDVEVLAGSRTIDRFAELEAELREGDEAALEPLIALLSSTEGLTAEGSSKLDRALEAVRRAGAGPVAAAPSRGAAFFVPPAPVAAPIAPAPIPVPEPVAAPVFAPTPAVAPVVDAAAASIVEVVVEVVVEVTAPRIPPMKSPGTLTDDPLAEAARKALKFHLARMLAREPGARDGIAAVELHGMRVATRRQRAAWRVFGDAFDERRTARHRVRLRSLARALGGVRDLDVLIEAAEGYRDRQSPTEAAAFERLLRAWRTRRDNARIVLVKELDSKRYRRWIDDYVDFVQTEGLGARHTTPIEPHLVRDSMPSRIWAAYEQVRAYESILRWADVTTLHELRIAAKWLRYTIEFVREPLGDEAGPVIERIVALQDHLGLLHDADVAAGLARRFLAVHRKRIEPIERAAIARYLLDRETELARLREEVSGPWQAVANPTFRRDLGRLVAGL